MVILSVIAVLNAVDPGASSQWVAGGAALALLTVAIGFTMRQQFNLVQENKLCNWRIGILVRLLTENGMTPPPEFWEGPPDIAAKKKRRLRVTWNDESNELGQTTRLMVSWMASILVFIICASLVVWTFVIRPISDLSENRNQDKCVSSLTADYFVSINQVLKAPPDSGTRDDAVALANTAAERIRNRDAICADGEPNKFDLPAGAEEVTK